MTDRVAKVESAIQHAKFIRRSIDSLAATKDKAFLKSVGITIDDDTSSSEDSEQEGNNEYRQLEIMNVSEFAALIADCEYNWFCIDERISGKTKCIDVQRLINDLKISQANKKKFQISYEVFLLDDKLNLSHQERIANQMNGFVVTDSDSDNDNPAKVNNIQSPLDPNLKAHIKK